MEQADEITASRHDDGVVPAHCHLYIRENEKQVITLREGNVVLVVMVCGDRDGDGDGDRYRGWGREKVRWCGGGAAARRSRTGTTGGGGKVRWCGGGAAEWALGTRTRWAYGGVGSGWGERTGEGAGGWGDGRGW
ncbi:protein FAM98B-like [Capsicum annuum]|uniref:protein FAM98B-like n=1 Tax=Capsicum annuum TaxID=4072 RepID=UPI001FB0702B|nr:protein FAM98B-like [Capsicum annuum]